MFHVLQHLLELRATAILRRKPSVGDVEWRAAFQRIQRTNVARRHVASSITGTQKFGTRIPPELGHASRPLAKSFVDFSGDGRGPTGAPSNRPPVQTVLQRRFLQQELNFSAG